MTVPQTRSTKKIPANGGMRDSCATTLRPRLAVHAMHRLAHGDHPAHVAALLRMTPDGLADMIASWKVGLLVRARDLYCMRLEAAAERPELTDALAAAISYSVDGAFQAVEAARACRAVGAGGMSPQEPLGWDIPWDSTCALGAACLPELCDCGRNGASSELNVSPGANGASSDPDVSPELDPERDPLGCAERFERFAKELRVHVRDELDPLLKSLRSDAAREDEAFRLSLAALREQHLGDAVRAKRWSRTLRERARERAREVSSARGRRNGASSAGPGVSPGAPVDGVGSVSNASNACSGGRVPSEAQRAAEEPGDG